MKKASVSQNRFAAFAAAAVTAGALFIAGSFTALAAGGLDMSTYYPGISVKPGESVNFSLNFENQSGGGRDTSLTIESIPDGWDGYFKGNSNSVNRIHINSGDNEGLATFSLTVPAETPSGTYQAVLLADAGEGVSDSLTLDITVSEAENGQSNFSSEYPEQEGASGTSFKFDTTLVNNRSREQSYSLSSNAPDGWQVSFTPSGQTTHVASVSVDSGGSQGISVEITPPETITKGEYSISCSAVSATETLPLDLKVTVTGSYKVELSTPSGLLSFDAYANDEKAVTLTVTNSGNVDLENLNLSSSLPSGWEARFDESAIDLLEAGASREITAYVKPSGDSMTGDYAAVFTVKNDITSGTADFRVSVKTRTTWGILAVVIIVVLIGGLGMIFKKYGRR